MWIESKVTLSSHQFLTKSTNDTTTAPNIQMTLAMVNTRKTAGPKSIPGHVLRDCAGELADVQTDILNISLIQATIPRCFKIFTIVPVAKKAVVSCLKWLPSHSHQLWWSVLNASSNNTSQPDFLHHLTCSCLLIVPTAPQRMQYPPPLGHNLSGP